MITEFLGNSMKALHIIALASIILNIILLGSLSNQKPSGTAIVPSQSHGPTYTIAILSPAGHPSLANIVQGFKAQLAELGMSCNFKEYNANGSKTLMRAQAEEIVSASPDLIFTIGTSASSMIHQLLTKQQRSIPLVFSAVSDPQELGLVKSLDHPEGITTGISDVTNHEPTQVKTFLTLKPNVQQIVLVYDPAQSLSLDKERHNFEQLFAAAGITMESLIVEHHNQVLSKTTSVLEQLLQKTNAADTAIMILTDHTTVSAVDSLIKLCNNTGVTLFTSELESVNKGAAIAFGIEQYQYGKRAAEQVEQILVQHIPISDIPVTPLQDFKVKVNLAAAQKQQLNIDPELLFLMRSSIIIPK